MKRISNSAITGERVVSTIPEASFHPARSKGAQKSLQLNPQLAKALYQHMQAQSSIIKKLADSKDKETDGTATDPLKRGGPTVLTEKGGFSGIGSEVDQMILHGQQAFAGVMRMLNIEMKQYPAAIASTAFGWTGVNFQLDGLSQGVGDQQRTGDSIKCMHLNLRLTIRQAAAATIPTVVRVMVVRSVDEPVSTLDLNAYDTTASAVNGACNWDQRKQYHTLYDETFVCFFYYAMLGVVQLHISKKLNSHIQFENGATTVEKGALQLVLWSDDNTNKPTVIGVSELHYVDN